MLHQPRSARLIAPAGALAALLLIAACGENDNDPGPGGVTVGEARALDDAAEMIKQRQLRDTNDDTSSPDTALPPQDAAEEPAQ